MKKLVIIGANEFQNPLILKAKEMGYETHVFAWRDGAVGEKNADYFYPISITEVNEIFAVCEKIKPSGVASIGSDLANITVAKLAEKLGLPGNTVNCVEKSTNKAAMRAAFRDAGIPTPYFKVVSDVTELSVEELEYPVIVKPTDRSGSRAITKVERQEDLKAAIQSAVDQSFEKKAIVESYIEGDEYSLESISYAGTHTCLAITKKFTTGAPHYIETGHIQPAPLSINLYERCIETIHKALDALEVSHGASHAEFKIDKNENIRIIEIGSRMGGDCIGSDLVPLSTGQDFVKMVIQTAVGEKPEIVKGGGKKVSAIRFLFQKADGDRLERIKKEHPEVLRTIQEPDFSEVHQVVDSGSRYGFYILQTDTMEEMEDCLHGISIRKPIELWETPIQKIYGLDFGDNEIYMKRDDLLGFSFGGNKVRFAEYFMKDMEQKACDGMIIYGNYHSNLCRILSAACKRESIPCYMIYNQDDIEESIDGNSLLIKQMNVIPVPCKKTEIAQTVHRTMNAMREKGLRPYYIYGNTLGQGNETVPMQSYVDAWKEFLTQSKKLSLKFDYIFLASSTNATQSGLIAGSLSDDSETKIVGISVNRGEKRGMEVLAENIKKYYEVQNKVLPIDWEKKLHFTDAYLCGGYGRYTDEVERLIAAVYRENGIGLDPIYTGKGFYGMLKYLEEHQICGKRVLFWHTGGTPLYFDYLNELAKEGK